MDKSQKASIHQYDKSNSAQFICTNRKKLVKIEYRAGKFGKVPNGIESEPKYLKVRLFRKGYHSKKLRLFGGFLYFLP